MIFGAEHPIISIFYIPKYKNGDVSGTLLFLCFSYRKSSLILLRNLRVAD